MLTPGSFVRLMEDPSRSGMITGVSEIRRNRKYWEVMLADGTGAEFYPESKLVAAFSKVDPIDELKIGRFAVPDRLRRLLLHHRLTGSLRDVIYSMDSTDTEFHAYQFKPVLKLLSSPAQGLLIADEVGLGKTIEAGLIWTELVARFDASRLLVICPKSLTEKWRLELREKFAVDARIVDAAGLLTHLNDHAETKDGFALIASLSSVRPPNDWEGEAQGPRADLCRYLVDQESSTGPIIDCLIFDEAHHLRNSKTLGYEFAQVAMRVSDYKLLLSATPINLQSEDLRNLLALVDPDSFDSPYAFADLNRQNKPLVKARDLVLNSGTDFSELLDTLKNLPRGDTLIVDRQLNNLQNELTNPALSDSKELRVRLAAMLEEMSLLGGIVNRTRRRDVNELQVKREVDDLRWQMTSDERLFYDSVSDIVRQYAYDVDAAERFLLATPQRLIASSLPAAFRHWCRVGESFSLDDEDEDGQSKVGPLSAKLARLCVSNPIFSKLELNDSKFGKLLEAILQHHTQGDEKIIIFSSFRSTLDYLAERLQASGVSVELMHGGIKEDRSSIVSRFSEHSGRRVLLTSEVGGEGLDMQFCRSLINFDLPWNPMKVEQRIGRIDRIGQKAERINVLSLIAEDTIEERIYDRLYLRLIRIQETLGSFEPILGNEISNLERRLLDPALSGEAREAEIERSATALINGQRDLEKLEEEASGLIAHGDMIYSRIEASRTPERRIGSDELVDYLHEALSNKYPGSRIDDAPDNPGLYEVTLSERAQLELRKSSSKAGRARTQLTRQSRVLVSFERQAGLPKRTELISATHPLVRLAVAVREEAARGSLTAPVVSVELSRDRLPELDAGLFLASISRWSVNGAIQINRLYFGAACLDGSFLDEQSAEKLVQAALRSGRAHFPDGRIKDLVDLAGELIETNVDASFDNFLGEEEARHFDRADTFIARLNKQQRHRLGDMEALLDRWKMSRDPKKLKMIPAQQKKANNLRARFEEKREKIEAARARFGHRNSLVGLIVVELR